MENNFSIIKLLNAQIVDYKFIHKLHFNPWNSQKYNEWKIEYISKRD